MSRKPYKVLNSPFRWVEGHAHNSAEAGETVWLDETFASLFTAPALKHPRLEEVEQRPVKAEDLIKAGEGSRERVVCPKVRFT